MNKLSKKKTENINTSGRLFVWSVWSVWSIPTTVHDLDLPGRTDRSIPDLYDLYDLYDPYDLAHVAGWEPFSLHGLGHVSWDGSVLTQILHNLSKRQVIN